MASINGMFSTFNNKFDGHIRSHLKNVYACLSMSILSAAAGAYTHVFTSLLRGGGLLYTLASLGMLFGLYSTPDNGKNRTMRLGMLLGFAFLTGLGLGPLLDVVIMVNPAIVPNAFMMSAIIFASFSGAALFAPDGQYLYLGGTLFSAMSGLMWLGIINLFFQSQLMYQGYIWGTLLVFCGFIVWDTQMIIEKRRAGSNDYISHSLDLFIDFVQVFRKLLIILTSKDENNKKRRQ